MSLTNHTAGLNPVLVNLTEVVSQIAQFRLHTLRTKEGDKHEDKSHNNGGESCKEQKHTNGGKNQCMDSTASLIQSLDQR